MAKEQYERPWLEVIALTAEDVITNSEAGGFDDYEGWNPFSPDEYEGYEGWMP